MGAKRRQYTKEFKLAAVWLGEESEKPLSQVARELGIRADMLRAWKRQVEGAGSQDAFPGHGTLPGTEEENRRLRRELELVQPGASFQWGPARRPLQVRRRQALQHGVAAQPRHVEDPLRFQMAQKARFRKAGIHAQPDAYGLFLGPPQDRRDKRLPAVRRVDIPRTQARTQIVATVPGHHQGMVTPHP